MYKLEIEVSYRTGDSLDSSDETHTIHIQWENLNIAKENLQAIKEHWQMYQRIENVGGWHSKDKNHEDVFKEYVDKWWFVPKNKELSHSHHCMFLKTDEGNLIRQWNPWCGYFEHLYGAEIVGVNSDLKFEI